MSEPIEHADAYRTGCDEQHHLDAPECPSCCRDERDARWVSGSLVCPCGKSLRFRAAGATSQAR